MAKPSALTIDVMNAPQVAPAGALPPSVKVVQKLLVCQHRIAVL